MGASVISFHPLEVVVAFDETVKLRNPFTVSTRIDHVAIPLAGEWRATGSDASLGSVWIFQQAPGAEYGPTVEVVVFSDDICAVHADSTLPTAVCFELETLNQDFASISGRLERLAIGKNLIFDVTKRIGPIAEPDGNSDAEELSRKYLVTSLTTSDVMDDRVALLEREIASVRELVELEPDCKCRQTGFFHWVFNCLEPNAFVHHELNFLNDIINLRANPNPFHVIVGIAQDD